MKVNIMENKTITIYLEANPNPNSLKLVADYMLVEPGQNYDFPDVESAKNAPKTIIENNLFISEGI